VPALEWDRPIMVLAQKATAWRTSGVGGVDLGSVAIQLGWLNSGTVSGSTFAQSPAALTGWTASDANAPWNGMVNGNVLQSRSSTMTGTGFMTVACSPGSVPEQYFYAIQITPPAAGPVGSPPNMTPIIDDVKIIYMPWDCAIVLQEENVD
jgi:hypothetical protein